MCRKLGFVQGEPDEMAYVELRWYPPGRPPLEPHSRAPGGPGR
jgi:hypothetical protein